MFPHSFASLRRLMSHRMTRKPEVIHLAVKRRLRKLRSGVGMPRTATTQPTGTTNSPPTLPLGPVIRSPTRNSFHPLRTKAAAQTAAAVPATSIAKLNERIPSHGCDPWCSIRLISPPRFSKRLCSKPHLTRTGHIGRNGRFLRLSTCASSAYQHHLLNSIDSYHRNGGNHRHAERCDDRSVLLGGERHWTR